MAKSEWEKTESKLLQYKEAKRRVYFHVTYHPKNPPLFDVQHLFEMNTCCNPTERTTFETYDIREVSHWLNGSLPTIKQLTSKICFLIANLLTDMGLQSLPSLINRRPIFN